MTDWLKTLVDNWEEIGKISSSVRKKIRSLFQKGNRSLGFIRNKAVFLEYYELSRKGFAKRYGRYIVPAEYRSYILAAIRINELYRKGEKKQADKLRKELHKSHSKAPRIASMYSGGVLSILFSRIDSLREQGVSDIEITGEASKLLDDLINEKALVFVNNYKTKESVYEEVCRQLRQKRFCLVFGSGRNVSKIQHILSATLKEKEFEKCETKTRRDSVGGIPQYHLVIYFPTTVSEQ